MRDSHNGKRRDGYETSIKNSTGQGFLSARFDLILTDQLKVRNDVFVGRLDESRVCVGTFLLENIQLPLLTVNKFIVCNLSYSIIHLNSMKCLITFPRIDENSKYCPVFSRNHF